MTDRFRFFRAALLALLTLAAATAPFARVAAAQDTLLVQSHGFQDGLGSCDTRGWTVEDRTTAVYAHVTDAWTINNSAVTGVQPGSGLLTFGATALTSQLSLPRVVAMTDSGFVVFYDVLPTSVSGLVEVYPGGVLRTFATFPALIAVHAGTRDPVTGEIITTTDYGMFRIPRAGGTPVLWGGAGSTPTNTTLADFNSRSVTQCAIDAAGDVFVADPLNDVVSMIRASDQQVIPLAGLVGTAGSSGDGGPAGSATLNLPTGVAVTPDGHTVYIGCKGDSRIRKVDLLTATITTLVSPNSPSTLALSPTGQLFSLLSDVIARIDAGPSIVSLAGTSTPVTQFASAANLDRGTDLKLYNVEGLSSGPDGSLYFGANHLIYRLAPGGTLSAIAGTPVPMTMGTRAFWFGADMTSAPGEVGHWVQDHGYGNGWNQRLNSPVLPAYTPSDNPQLDFDCVVEFNLAVGATLVPFNEYVVLEGHNPVTGVWSQLLSTVTSPGQAPLTMSYENGSTIFHVTSLIGDPTSANAANGPYDRVRIRMQTDRASSSEDGQSTAGPMAGVLVDNVTLTRGGTPMLPPLTFEDGTTGAWTTSAYNGAYDLGATIFNRFYTHDGAPTTDTPVLTPNVDPLNDPSCAWTFRNGAAQTPDNVFARITGPWVALEDSSQAALIHFAGRLPGIDSYKGVSVTVRAKRAGQPRPWLVAQSFARFNSGTNGGDALVPYSERTLRFPIDFDTSNPAPQFETPKYDSVQVVYEVQDFRETIPGAGTPVPTALPYLDDLSVAQTLVDTDHDGVPDLRDACPTLSAAGEDADGDGCPDPTASLHHVRSWAAADRPIHYRLSADGDPTITDGSDLNAIRAAFTSWALVPGAALSLQEDAVTTQKSASAFDGIDLITFEDPDVVFPPSVLAATTITTFTKQVAYNDHIVLPGQIVDADMLFNPGVVWRTGTRLGDYDLQSVATHEAGHFLGLSHSPVLKATMFYVIQPQAEARTLESDDQAAAAAAYPGPSLGTAYGTIRGHITRGQDHSVVEGAVVTAVRLDGGGAPIDTVDSDYTREDGSYALYRLPAGSYAVRVDPLDGSAQGLTASRINDRVNSIAQTNFLPEWWSVPESDRDDPTLKTMVSVNAGATTSGIDIITNVDTIPPVILRVSPANSTANVNIDAALTVLFSEPIAIPTLSGAFKLHITGDPNKITGTGQLLEGNRLVFAPAQPLAFGTSYTLDIGTTLTDANGVPLAAPYTTTFSTLARPPVAITGIVPHAAPIGALLTISGSGFDPTQGAVFVHFNIGSPADTTVVPNILSSSSLLVRVPPNALPTSSIQVSVGLLSSNSFGVQVLPPTAQASPTPLGAPVTLDFTPADVTLSPDGLTVFVAGDGGFSTCDLTQPTRTAVKHSTLAANALALTPDGDRLLITHALAGAIDIVDSHPGSGTFGQPISNVTGLTSPHGIGVSPDGRRAYVVDGTNKIKDIDLSAGPTQYTVIRVRTLTQTLNGQLAVAPDGAGLVLGANGSPPLILAQTSDTTATTYPFAPGLQFDGGIAVSPISGEVLGAGPSAFGQISYQAVAGSFSSPDFGVQGSLAPGGTPTDIAMAHEGQSAFVSNQLFNSLDVIDLNPASPTYHARVATVTSGQGPVAVAAASVASIVAVANGGSHNVSIFTYGAAGAGALSAVNPPVAIPGDQVALVASGATYTAGTQIDLGAGLFAPTVAGGSGAGFTMPALTQRQTNVTLQAPAGARSLALPITVVAPIDNPVASSGGIFALSDHFCGDTGQGYSDGVTTSPDGRVTVMESEFPNGCLLLNFIYTGADGATPLGTQLTSFGSARGFTGLTFSADGKQLWYARYVSGGGRLDADPASPTFGQALGGLQPMGAMGIAADPLGRYLIASGLDISYNAFTIRSDQNTGTPIDTIPNINSAVNFLFSPEGKYLIVSYDNGTTFEIRDAATARTVLATTPAHPFPGAQLKLLVTRDGRRLVGLYPGNLMGVWNLDTSSGALGAELFYGIPANIGAASLSDMVPGPRHGTVIVSSSTTPQLFLMDVTPGGAAVAPLAGQYTQPIKHLGSSPDGRRLWTFSDLPQIGGGGNAIFPIQMELQSLSPATQLVVEAGDQQSAPAGSTLPLPVVVRALDGAGAPQAGVVVRFSQDQFNATLGGSLDGTIAASADRLTDANGEAHITWHLPNSPGAWSLSVRGLGIPNAAHVTANAVASDADIIPVVTQVGPADGATGINAGSAVFLRFNQHMQHATVESRFTLTAGGSPVAGRFTWSNLDELVLFQPAAPLPFGATCVLTLTAGGLDAESQAVVNDAGTKFTVQSPPTLALNTISPPAGPAGAPVVLSGTGFSSTSTNNVISFNGALAPVGAASALSLETHVPLAATTGPVTVQVGTNVSVPLGFTVLPVSSTPGAVISNLPSGQGIRVVVVTPDGRHAYVSNPTSNDVTGLRVSDGSVIGRVPVGVDPIGLGIVPSGRRAYVANAGSDNVSVIDIDSTSATFLRVIKTIPVGHTPTGLVVAVQPNGVKVVVANSGDGTVSIIDAQDGNATQDQVTSTTSTGTSGKGGSITVTNDGGTAFVGTGVGVVAIDLLDGTHTLLPTQAAVASLALTPTGAVLLALLEDGSILVIGAQPGTSSFNQVVATTSTGTSGKGGSITVTNDGGLAYVSVPSSNSVLVFSISSSTGSAVLTHPADGNSVAPGPAVTLTLKSTIATGQGPSGIGLDPNGHFALVVNSGSGTISVIGFPNSLPPIVCGFDFNPNTLNLKSMGRWVTCAITPPSPYTPQQIVRDSLRINGIVKVDPSAPWSIDGGTLTVKFLRSEISLILQDGDQVPVTVTGIIVNRVLTGTDTIKVKGIPKVISPIAHGYRQANAPALVQWEVPKGTGSDPVSIIYSLDQGYTWKLGATGLPNTGSSSAWIAPAVANDSVKVAVAVVESGDPTQGDFDALLGVSDYFVIAAGALSVEDAPATLTFAPLVPNPSVNGANLRFGLPRAAKVEIHVFDVQGRRVKTVLDAAREAGWHTTRWDATDERGNPAGSGLYFVRMRVEGKVLEQRLTLLR